MKSAYDHIIEATKSLENAAAEIHGMMAEAHREYKYEGGMELFCKDFKELESEMQMVQKAHKIINNAFFDAGWGQL